VKGGKAFLKMKAPTVGKAEAGELNLNSARHHCKGEKVAAVVEHTGRAMEKGYGKDGLSLRRQPSGAEKAVLDVATSAHKKT